MDEQYHVMSQWFGNIISAGAIIGAFAGVLPAIGAIVAIVWYAIQIKESDTFREYRMARKIRKIARLKARLIMLESKIAPLPPGFEEKL